MATTLRTSDQAEQQHSEHNIIQEGDKLSGNTQMPIHRSTSRQRIQAKDITDVGHQGASQDSINLLKTYKLT